MANLIDEKAINKLIIKTLEEDLNEQLNKATKEVIARLESEVKRNVAARMIALASSDYNLQYHANTLQIRVILETKHV